MIEIKFGRLRQLSHDPGMFAGHNAVNWDGPSSLKKGFWSSLSDLCCLFNRSDPIDPNRAFLKMQEINIGKIFSSIQKGYEFKKLLLRNRYPDILFFSLRWPRPLAALQLMQPGTSWQTWVLQPLQTLVGWLSYLSAKTLRQKGIAKELWWIDTVCH